MSLASGRGTMRVIPPAARSRMMRSIRKADTGPERTVRRLLRDIGVTYWLHAAELPGYGRG
jgi:G:T-mismatch repair DNA endonuclease (very short patch repair protein)